MLILALIVLGWLLCGWVTFRVWLRRSPPNWDRYAKMWWVWDIDNNAVSIHKALVISLGLWPFMAILTSACAIWNNIHKAGSLVIPRAYRFPPRDP